MTSSAPPLSGWYVILCRPVGQNAALARRVRALGGTPVSLPALRLCPPDDLCAARAALQAALACDAVLFTSPAAVRCAARLLPLSGTRGPLLAVGAGTARALRRLGLHADAPARMDSEGLLALPALAHVASAGLVTAPGGRGHIAPTLAARGVQVVRANVYRRAPARPARAQLAALRAIDGPAALLLSSAEALDTLRSALSPADAAHLARAGVIASSARLADLALERGFRVAAVARSATAPDLLAALREVAARSRIR